ncbi:protein FAM210B, mitochondrial isoform X2 [Notothenia coriiceps]|uniref:Protein FAM210B, mitochondrial isoform X2 n=1 Tax=Notothenia coriiceps TaxID=8208 RepID=A0A6I9NKW1_9TELE|nr:PREDICTED: protein FAM210B isoform X2 [Notothenia coriiceps]
MLLCRTASLSALDPAFKSTGSFLARVKANRLRDVTVTLRKGYTFQRYRCFCGSVPGVDATLELLGKQQQQQQKQQHSPDRGPVQHWDSPCAPHRRHLDRVATIAVNLSECVQSKHGTMQTRAFSTKKSEAVEEHTANNKEKAPTTSSSTEKTAGESEPEGGKPNKTQQLKKVFKEYGAVGVSFHIGMSLMSLGMFYLFVSSGMDMAAVLCKVGFSEAVVRSKMVAGTSTFVLAYAIHKLFAPLRISITLVSVPLIVRYFRKTGLFKPPTPAP